MQSVVSFLKPLLLLVLVSSMLTGHASASRVPGTFVPESDNTVLLEVAPSNDETLQALRQDRQSLTENPDDLELALNVARRSIQLGRSMDDPRLFGYAQGALDSWWEQPEPPSEVLVLRATIHQYRHRFAVALRDLDRAIERNPRHGQARLTRAVIYTVQARYQEALKDCAVLSEQASQMIALACSATPASLTGSAKPALALLSRIRPTDQFDDVTVWAMTTAAEIAERLGEADTETHFKAALDATMEQPDRYLTNAYADWLLRQQRPADALAELEAFADSDGSLLRIAMAHKQQADQGGKAAARQLADNRRELGARFDAERERGGATHQREAAMFALHVNEDKEEALWLARDNFRNQREPLDAMTLLQAALAANAPEQAATVVEWFRGNGITDVRLEPLVKRIEESPDFDA